MDKRKMIIRIGRNTLSFTMPNLSDNERPYIHEPYTVKGGISMAANLREAFKTADLMAIDTRRAQVLIDTPSMLVPVEQFEEDSIVTIFNHTFPSGDEQRTILYNVLPNLKSVCLFAINRDLRGVLCDKFDDVVFIQSMTPVWRYLHQRSFTGHRNKLYAYFHERQLDIFCFQQNRFKFCNSFDASKAEDAIFFVAYVWNQLQLSPKFDELHLMGDIPEKNFVVEKLKRYIQKVFVINPQVDFNEHPVTAIKGVPFDLQTLVVKGR